MAEGGEVVRVDKQFLLQRERPVDGRRRPATGEADRRVERPRRTEITDIPEEERPVGREQLHRAVDHLGQVIDTGEVLDDRVDDDRVEVARGKPREVVGRLAPQCDLRGQGGIAAQVLADLPDDGCGQVGRPVRLRVGGELREQQPGTDADLQDAPGPQLPDPGDGVLPPLPHVLQRNRSPVVAAGPPREVLGEDGGADLLVLVGVDLAPLPDLRTLGGRPLRAGQLGRHQVGHQPLPARRIVPGHHGGLGDIRPPGERGLDLAGLHPVPADLDLPVGTPQEVQVPVRPTPYQVTGAVDPLPRLPERIGDEPFGGQRRPSEIPPREADSGDVQLPGDPVWHGTEPGVQDVRSGAPDGASDRGCRAVVGAAAECVDRVLGGAVQVVPVGALGVAEPAPDRLRHRLAAEQHQRRPVALQQSFLDEQVGVGRGDVDHVHPVRLAVRDQGLGVPPQFLIADVHLVAFDQPEQFLPGHVEGEGHGVRDPQPPPAGRGHRRVEDLPLVVDLHVGQTPVGGDDALRPPGGPGGVDHVRRVFQAERRPLLGRQRLARHFGNILIEEDAGHGSREPGRHGGGGEQQDRPGVVEHHGQPVVRVVQLQRQVRRPRPEHREQRGHHVDGARQPERDDLLRPSPVGQHEPGQPVDPRVQLRIGDPLLAEHQRHRLRGAGGLRGQQVGDALPWYGHPAGGPLHLQRRPLAGQQRIDPSHRGVRVGGEPVEQQDEPVEQGLRLGAVDQVGPVREGDPDPPARRDDQVDRVVGGVHVGHGRRAVPVVQVGEPVLGVAVPEHEERVEQPPVPGLGLEHPQPEVLVRQQLQPLPLDPPEQREHRFRRVERDPRRHRVEEHPDDVLHVRHLAGPTGHGGAEHHVGTAGGPREHQPPGGVEHRVEGEPVAPRGLPDPVAESSGQLRVQAVGDDRPAF